jgi:hypothetical protein
MYFVMNRRKAGGLVLFLALFLLPACGKKANPVIPEKTVPQKVERIHYRVQEGTLVLYWAVPKQNTDGSPLTDLKGFSLTRGDWPTKDLCPTCPPPFKDTFMIDLKGPVQPDLDIGADQVRLRLRELKAGSTYFFQVKAVSRRGAESEPSPTLQISWEIPFAPPQGLELLPDPQGLKISWKPSTALVDGSKPERPALYLLEKKVDQGPWEVLGGGPLSVTTFTDTGLNEKTTYTYRVKALRQVGGFVLESEASGEKETVYLRPFPPPAVQDLVVFSTPAGVELRWQGIEGVSLAGYHVYRRQKNEKTARRLTAAPHQDTVYEDGKITRGETYVYSVSAVGPAPTFLEGTRSKEVEITVSP